MEKMVKCPYNQSHQVKLSRIQQHIVKCEKKYPPLEICPYNYSHRMPQSELLNHVANCPSKDVVSKHKSDVVSAGAVQCPVACLPIGQRAQDDPDHEWWD